MDIIFQYKFLRRTNNESLIAEWEEIRVIYRFRKNTLKEKKKIWMLAKVLSWLMSVSVKDLINLIRI